MDTGQILKYSQLSKSGKDALIKAVKSKKLFLKFLLGKVTWTIKYNADGSISDISLKEL